MNRFLASLYTKLHSQALVTQRCLSHCLEGCRFPRSCLHHHDFALLQELLTICCGDGGWSMMSTKHWVVCSSHLALKNSAMWLILVLWPACCIWSTSSTNLVQRWNSSLWTIYLKLSALLISSRCPINSKWCSESFSLSSNASNPTWFCGLSAGSLCWLSYRCILKDIHGFLTFTGCIAHRGSPSNTVSSFFGKTNPCCMDNAIWSIIPSAK